jgi:hypothetical protein
MMDVENIAPPPTLATPPLERKTLQSIPQLYHHERKQSFKDV